MKVFVFQGGLGNQIFEYAFYKKQLENNPNLEYLFPVKSHNGFELNKWFDVTLNKASFLKKILYIVAIKLKEKKIFNLIADKDQDPNDDNYFVTGFFQDKQYFDNIDISFKEFNLSKANREYLEQIKRTNSVAIHVRRGDYLQPPYDEIYGGICTSKYYQEAVEIIKGKLKDPVFYIFSNDKDWVKNNMNIQNAIYIDCNTGMNSAIDLYLMAHAKANIIANSSFSFWGAYLNRRKPFVVYPQKWFKSKYIAPNIFPSDWLGI